MKHGSANDEGSFTGDRDTRRIDQSRKYQEYTWEGTLAEDWRLDQAGVMMLK